MCDVDKTTLLAYIESVYFSVIKIHSHFKRRSLYTQQLCTTIQGHFLKTKYSFIPLSYDVEIDKTAPPTIDRSEEIDQ